MSDHSVGIKRQLLDQWVLSGFDSWVTFEID